jgi:hypothetical protein
LEGTINACRSCAGIQSYSNATAAALAAEVAGSHC